MNEIKQEDFEKVKEKAINLFRKNKIINSLCF